MKWPMVKLGDLIIQDVGGISLKRDQFTDSGTIVVPKKAISSDVNIDHSNLVYTSKKTAISYENYKADNSFLITTLRDLVPTGPNLGRICEINVSEPFLLAQGVYAFKLNDLVCPKFITYYSNSIEFRKQLLRSKVGSTQVHIRSGDFKAAKIPLPPLNEQKRIAAILDKADSIRRKRQQAIKLADEFLRSVFLDMFGDLVSTEGYASSQKYKIKDLVDYIDYRGKTPEKSVSGIPLITAKNVKKGYVDEEPREFIPVDTYDAWMTRGLPLENDLLFTTEAPLGNVALLGKYDKVVIGQRLIALRSKGKVTHEFLMYLLLHPFIEGLILHRSSGSTVKGIRTKELYEIELPVPDIALQERFSSLYWQLKKLRGKEQRSLLECSESFNALSQKAFAGEL
ncbi:restriction endonuclease subunit S [Idiomarina abyssalis]|uniref:restriction endonuclease subunit S n=1 Tax=Idiomarina abyssalis TaxID=86102 RepID=UPI003A8F68C9